MGYSVANQVTMTDPFGNTDVKIFNTDGSHSTLEVVNIFLGSGNDQFTVNSTLIPGPDHNADGSVGYVSEHGGITTVHGGGNTTLMLDDAARRIADIVCT